MASVLKVDTLTGVTTAGSMQLPAMGFMLTSRTTTNLQHRLGEYGYD